MAKNTVKKAIESVASGDVRGLRKHINEALVNKVRKALDIKEKKIAKGLIEAATNTSLREDSNALTDQSKVTQLIKSELKVKSVEVDEYTSSGKPVVEFTAKFKTKDKDYNTLFVVCHEEPSKKSSGKNIWFIRLDTGDDASYIKSDEFTPGDSSKSLSSLKAALGKASSSIKAITS